MSRHKLSEYVCQRLLRLERAQEERRSRLPRAPGLQAWPRLPAVSLVVAAWNEDRNIERFLQSYRDLDYPDKTLVLVAGGEDRTFELASAHQHPSVLLLEQRPGEGKSGALKRGLKQAAGEIVCLTDADCILDTTSFHELIFPLASGQERAVTGHARPHDDQYALPFIRAQATHLSRKMLMVPDRYVWFLIGANCAVSRELMERHTTTTPPSAVGEDYSLALSLRADEQRILYQHSSEIQTCFPETLREYVRQQSRWHRGHLLLNRQWGKRRFFTDTLESLRDMLLLLMPAAALAWGPIGGLVWLLSWSISFIPYAKAHLLSVCPVRNRDRVAGTPVCKGHTQALLQLFRLMLAGWVARVTGLLHSIIPLWRRRW